jgi:hypothetical protein
MATTGYSCFWLVISKKSFHLKPLGQINRHLVRSIYGRSSLKNAHFLPRHLQTWLSQAILVSDWSISKRSSLKPLRQMNRNFVGGSYGRPSIKSAHFVPIRKQTLPQQAILVSEWSIKKNSSPLKPLGQINRNLVGPSVKSPLWK